MVILEHDGNTDMPTIHDLETPAVLIDMDRVERNIQQMQAACDKHNVQFRPHIKTHKIPGLAQMQLDAGAVGIACQKTTEAEVFAEAGFTDIQLPYNIVGPAKTARLARLAKQATITVTADSLPVIEGIAAAAADAGVTINVLAEIVGPNDRTGAIPENILELAQCVQGHDSLHFAGVMIYPSTPDVRPRLQATLKLLADHNIPVEQVSGGGSGAITTLGDMPELTELRVGTYLFWDWRSVTKGWTTLEQCAMRIRATVVSANDPARVILDTQVASQSRPMHRAASTVTLSSTRRHGCIRSMRNTGLLISATMVTCQRSVRWCTSSRFIPALSPTCMIVYMVCVVMRS
jgi:D-serine deaminase-like pyridoxal phosphate-dependent protein